MTDGCHASGSACSRGTRLPHQPNNSPWKTQGCPCLAPCQPKRQLSPSCETSLCSTTTRSHSLSQWPLCWYFLLSKKKKNYAVKGWNRFLQLCLQLVAVNKELNSFKYVLDTAVIMIVKTFTVLKVAGKKQFDITVQILIIFVKLQS